MKLLSNIATYFIIFFVLLALTANGVKQLVSEHRGFAFLLAASILALVLIK